MICHNKKRGCPKSMDSLFFILKYLDSYWRRISFMQFSEASFDFSDSLFFLYFSYSIISSSLLSFNETNTPVSSDKAIKPSEAHSGTSI